MLGEQRVKLDENTTNLRGTKLFKSLSKISFGVTASTGDVYHLKFIAVCKLMALMFGLYAAHMKSKNAGFKGDIIINSRDEYFKGQLERYTYNSKPIVPGMYVGHLVFLHQLGYVTFCSRRDSGPPTLLLVKVKQLLIKAVDEYLKDQKTDNISLLQAFSEYYERLKIRKRVDGIM